MESSDRDQSRSPSADRWPTLELNSVAFGDRAEDHVGGYSDLSLSVIGDELAFEWSFCGEAESVRFEVYDCEEVVWCAELPIILISVASTCRPDKVFGAPFWDPSEGAKAALITVYLRDFAEERLLQLEEAVTDNAEVLFGQIETEQVRERLSHFSHGIPGPLPLSDSWASEATPEGVSASWGPVEE